MNNNILTADDNHRLIQQEFQGAFSILPILPIFGTISLLSDIFTKATMNKEHIAGNHYYEYLNDKSYFKLVAYIVPVFGSLLWIYDSHKLEKRMTKAAKALSQCENQQQVDYLLSRIKSWEKSDVAKGAVNLNHLIYSMLPNELKSRHAVAMEAMKGRVSVEEIPIELRNDLKLMFSAVTYSDVPLNYLSDDLKSDPRILKGYTTRCFNFKRGEEAHDVRSLPTKALQILFKRDELFGYTLLDRSVLLNRLGREHIKQMSKDDQKKLIATLFKSCIERNQPRRDVPYSTYDRFEMGHILDYFSKNAVDEFLAENESEHSSKYTIDMLNRLIKYRKLKGQTLSKSS